jgi:pyruvate dehydrogenase kinase 2/3/4
MEFRKWMRVGPHDALPGTMEGDLTRFLDRFFLSRIGLRLLIEQHLALREQCAAAAAAAAGGAPAAFVGVIERHMRPLQVARDAVSDARQIVERAFGVCPDVELHGDEDFTLPYIPSHLHHMLFELTKNAMRAVVEAHGEVVNPGAPIPLYRDPRSGLPPVVLTLGSGKRVSDVSFRVSDRGGGMSRPNTLRAFSFFYTTYVLPTTGAGKPIDLLEDDYGADVPVAGLGVGLPMSRLYARYFGGDLRLASMEGHGTDAFLWLRRLGDANEPLFANDVLAPPAVPQPRLPSSSLTPPPAAPRPTTAPALLHGH